LLPAFREVPDSDPLDEKELFALPEAEMSALNEATRIASEIPSASIGTIEVWPTRKLVVDGVARDA
jgi:hypothetical protein